MPGMNSGLNVDDPTVVAALLHQGLIILAVFAVLSIAWVAVRRPQAAGAAGGQRHPARTPLVPGRPAFPHHRGDRPRRDLGGGPDGRGVGGRPVLAAVHAPVRWQPVVPPRPCPGAVPASGLAAATFITSRLARPHRAPAPAGGRRPAGATMRPVETRSISVTGMSCDHCARAVQAEVGKLPGVADVDVDVTAGRVRITAEPLPDDAALREAIEEAGYEFAG